MGQEQSAQRFQAHPSIGARAFDDVIFLVDTSRGILHELNAVGTRIWQLSDGERSLDTIAETLAKEFEVSVADARQDLQRFVEDLVARELLLPVKESP